MKITLGHFIGFSTGLILSVLFALIIRINQMQDKIKVLEQHTELLKVYAISIDKELAMVKSNVIIPMEK